MTILTSPGLDQVNSPNHEYLEMLSHWALPEALLGGTYEMRRKGKTYLPQYEGEKDASYKKRLERSILNPLYRRTLNNTISKPFSHPIELEDFNSAILDWSENIDLQGNHLNVFARDVFFNAWNYGKSHIFVNYPKGGLSLSKADQELLGVRPYFVHLKANQIFGWQSYLAGGNIPKLRSVRWFTVNTEGLGRFGSVVVPRIVSVELGDGGVSYSTFDLNESKEFVETSSGLMLDGEGSPLQEIPLVTFYINRSGFLTSTPVFEDVGYINQQHWVSNSDQMNILTWARIPVLFGQGFLSQNEDGSLPPPIKFASGEIIEGPADARLSYVEHSGAAITAGRQHLQDLEDAASMAGLEVLISNSRSGNVSATETAINTATSNTTIKEASMVFADALESAFVYAVKYEPGLDENDVGTIRIHTDYNISPLAVQELQEISRLYSMGAITLKTLLQEAKRRGILSDDVNPQDEIDLAAEEQPLIGASTLANTNIAAPKVNVDNFGGGLTSNMVATMKGTGLT